MHDISEKNEMTEKHHDVFVFHVTFYDNDKKNSKNMISDQP